MSQNMLPFDARERRRYGLSAMRLRNEILAFTQRNSFRRADGIIFLSRHAERIVTAAIARPVRSVVIPHGIDDQFRREPRPQRSLDACTPAEPFRLLYVSIIDTYKHQWNVAEAVAGLRREGLPVAIRFVGPAYPPALALLDAALRRLDPDGEFMSYDGPLPHAELPKAWVGVDACVFASSCENLPIILLEAMAAGMPIACSDREPMPEVLGTDGMFFDPESPTSIARALRKLATQPKLRDALAWAGFERTREMTWQRCARATLSFLAAVAHATT
jgi:glycosyltransferase involved in cell wall biosynthesis